MVMWIILLLYLAVMIGIGVYCRKMAGSVQNFVLGGRNLGPWFTAFAYGTSYFSAVVFIGYAGQFGWNYGVASTWVGIGNARYRQFAGLVAAGQPHPLDEPPSQRHHHAGVL